VHSNNIVIDKPNAALFIFVTLSTANNTHYNDASYYILPLSLRRLVPERVNTYRPGLGRVEDEVCPSAKTFKK